MKPYPTIYTEKALKRPSSMQISAVARKAPKVRIFQKDEIEDFKIQDIIYNFEDLSEHNAPRGYQCEKTENFILLPHSFKSNYWLPKLKKRLK